MVDRAPVVPGSASCRGEEGEKLFCILERVFRIFLKGSARCDGIYIDTRTERGIQNLNSIFKAFSNDVLEYNIYIE